MWARHPYGPILFHFWTSAGSEEFHFAVELLATIRKRLLAKHLNREAFAAGSM
jgi:hypothetical protein